MKALPVGSNRPLEAAYRTTFRSASATRLGKATALPSPRKEKQSTSDVIPCPTSNRSAHALHLRVTTVHAQRPSTEPDNSRVHRRNEPQNHARQIHPHRMLQSNLATLPRRRVGWYEDSAEKSKQCRPEDEQDPVPAEGPVTLDERYGIDEDCEG